MNNKVQMAVPAINGQQLPFDKDQAVTKACECGCDLFTRAIRIAQISRMAPGNRTGKDVTLETNVYLYWKCGRELGKESEKNLSA